MGNNAGSIITGIVVATGAATAIAVTVAMISGNKDSGPNLSNPASPGYNENIEPYVSPRDNENVDPCVGPRKNNNYDRYPNCDYHAKRIIRRQEGGLWCGYAAVQGMMSLNGIDVTQGQLADDLLDINKNLRAIIGNLTPEDMTALFNKHGLHTNVVLVNGGNFGEELQNALRRRNYAIIGPGPNRHWVIAQLDEGDPAGKNLLIHDPIFSKIENGMMVPQRYSLEEYCNNWKNCGMQAILELSDKNDTVVRNEDDSYN